MAHYLGGGQHRGGGQIQTGWVKYIIQNTLYTIRNAKYGGEEGIRGEKPKLRQLREEIFEGGNILGGIVCVAVRRKMGRQPSDEDPPRRRFTCY